MGDILIEIGSLLAENIIEIVVGTGTIITLLFTKSMTAEQIKKQKEKKLETLKKKNEKTKEKLLNALKEEENLEKEVKKE